MKLFWFLLALTFPSVGFAQTVDSLTAAADGLGQHTVLILFGLTILSLAPGILIMVTCFPFLIIVFSILRQAIGLQQAPPNMLIVTLALFLSWFIMDPVLQEIWSTALKPLQDGSLGLSDAIQRAIVPLQGFMSNRTNPETLAHLSEIGPAGAGQSTDFAVLVPSFLLSEIQRAFEIGFLIALPFLIIDLVVAAVLMSMGMMMVPPVVVSLPFKLAFFVVVDGWTLIAGALVRSYH